MIDEETGIVNRSLLATSVRGARARSLGALAERSGSAEVTFPFLRLHLFAGPFGANKTGVRPRLSAPGEGV